MFRHLILAATTTLVPQLATAQTFARMEVRSIDSVTLTGEQFLTGDTKGKPVMLAGELRIPRPGNDRLPAVILVHGSGGVNASHERWAQELNSIGVATLILDTFSGRGIVSTVNDQSQLHSLAMMVDAYRALGALAGHARIDPERIAVMGFSKGAVAAVYSSNERFRKLHAPGNLQFAAHIGLYTPCNVRYKSDERTTGKPIRLYHGITDDWVAIEPCRAYVARLQSAGAPATLTEYPGAYHAYDAFMLKEPIKFPQAQTTRRCFLEEGQNGAILNSKTGKAYELNDGCVEKGTQVAYNAAAHEATVKAVKEFLVATFRLPAP
ncbi:MAG TPA: dienelactone hydrolase family protein [Burkholderiales bacterium]